MFQYNEPIPQEVPEEMHLTKCPKGTGQNSKCWLERSSNSVKQNRSDSLAKVVITLRSCAFLAICDSSCHSGSPNIHKNQQTSQSRQFGVLKHLRKVKHPKCIRPNIQERDKLIIHIDIYMYAYIIHIYTYIHTIRIIHPYMGPGPGRSLGPGPLQAGPM